MLMKRIVKGKIHYLALFDFPPKCKQVFSLVKRKYFRDNFRIYHTHCLFRGDSLYLFSEMNLKFLASILVWFFLIQIHYYGICFLSYIASSIKIWVRLMIWLKFDNNIIYQRIQLCKQTILFNFVLMWDISFIKLQLTLAQ